jgi:DtxR family Mn-dependent transcriptional regulator
MSKETQQLSASLEDYLETIYNIIREKHVARAKEIANQLKVSRSSVTEAFRSLSKKGLINYAPYEVITLTPKGENLAEDVIHRHQALKNFFIKILAIDNKLAEDGACKIEHAAPREIIERLIQFVKFIEICPRGGEELINSFRIFCKTGKTQENCENCISSCLNKEAQ